MAGLALLTLTTSLSLSGCDPAENLPQSHQIPDACAHLVKTVPFPKARPGEDWRSIAARYRVALRKANFRIEEIGACEREVRRQYGVDIGGSDGR